MGHPYWGKALIGTAKLMMDGCLSYKRLSLQGWLTVLLLHYYDYARIEVLSLVMMGLE
jgi:hypothetical protein